MITDIILSLFFPFRVIIFQRRESGSHFVKIARARRKRYRNDGTETWKLTTGEEIKPPPFECLMETKKGTQAILYCSSPKEYKPAKIFDDDIHVMDEDMRIFFARALENNAKRFEKQESFLVKNLPIILLVVSVFLIIFLLNQTVEAHNTLLGQITGKLQPIADKFAEAAQSVGRTVSDVNVHVPMPPT